MAWVLSSVVWRGLAVSSLLTGCILDNPDFGDPVETSQGSDAPTLSGTSGTSSTTATTTTASESESSGGSMSATGTTTEAGSTTAVTGTTEATGTTTTGEGTTTTGNPDFEPLWVQNYVDGKCNYVIGCFPQQQATPAKLFATECFSTDLALPFAIESVSALIDYQIGKAPINVSLHSADAPNTPPITAVDLPAFSGAQGFNEFILPEPIVVESSEFCVRLTTGNGDTSLPIGLDSKTVGTPNSYVAQQNNCKIPFSPLDEYFQVPQATWCMAIKLAPPP